MPSKFADVVCVLCVCMCEFMQIHLNRALITEIFQASTVRLDLTGHPVIQINGNGNYIWMEHKENVQRKNSIILTVCISSKFKTGTTASGCKHQLQKTSWKPVIIV